MTVLYQEIRQAADRLIELVRAIPFSTRNKAIDAGNCSVSDLIAYQIGWGKALIRWYEAGLEGLMPDMPGDGFLKWQYAAISRHFYQTYSYDRQEEQFKMFEQVVIRILDIVKCEDRSGRLDRTGIWLWCTLPSGKQWPLSKWIRVNTASPYKRAAQLIKKGKIT